MKHTTYQILLTATLILAILTPHSYAADPGHIASSISSGTFESGNYTFPDSTFITNRLGIGTTTPLAKLHLSGATAEAAMLRIDNVGTNGRNYALYSSENTSAIGAGKFSIYDYSGGGNRLTIDSSGNVGIGVTGPAVNLDVEKSTGSGRQDMAYFLAGPSATGNGATIAVGSTQTTTGYITGLQTKTNEGDLIFGTQSAGSYSERVRILGSNGNVGIGTTSPSMPLEVRGANNIANFSSSAASSVITFTPSGQKVWRIGAGDTNTGDFGIRQMTDNIITLYSNSAGNVGIGTTSPGAELDVKGTNDGIRITDAGNGGEQILTFTAASGSASYTWNIWGDPSGGGNGNLYIGPTVTNPTTGATMTFQKTTGNVGIGTTGPLSKLSVGGVGNANYAIYGYGSNTGVRGYGANGVYGASINGNGYGILGSAETGVYGASNGSGTTAIGVWGGGPAGGYDFYAGGAGTDYGTSSSIRLKNNITEINNALDKVLNITGVYFNWKIYNNSHGMGFIAEDVGKYIPEVVQYDDALNQSNHYTDKDGKDRVYASGMDYGALTPVLVEAIKEQQQEIDYLNDKINNLTLGNISQSNISSGIKNHRVYTDNGDNLIIV